MNEPFVFHSVGEQETKRFGSALADQLPNGSVVGLIGTLGSGKTRIVQAVAAATGVDVGQVVSPTYVVIHEYQGRRPIYHFDLYRLKDEDEYFELGADEYFEQEGLTFLEWADRFESCLPAERLDVHVDIRAEHERVMRCVAHGKQYETVVENLQRQLE